MPRRRLRACADQGQNAEHAQGAPAAFLDSWRGHPLGQAFGAVAAERIAMDDRFALECLAIGRRA
jgi:hypothetical protein